ncbi:MAG: hypothetical protein EOO29_39325, partial [Comamonadaceae bacterium]
MHTATHSAATTRSRQAYSPWFWAMLGVLVMAQFAALALLCSHQVRKAQARDTHYVAQQMATADCLRNAPAATAGACRQGLELVRVSAEAQSQTQAAVATSQPGAT